MKQGNFDERVCDEQDELLGYVWRSALRMVQMEDASDVDDYK